MESDPLREGRIFTTKISTDLQQETGLAHHSLHDNNRHKNLPRASIINHQVVCCIETLLGR